MELSIQLQETVSYLKSKAIENAEAGIVLGTGLNGLLKYVDVLQTISYREIPHFPEATVEFHQGNLLYGMIGKTKVVVMQGRYHYYEGYDL